MLREWWGKLASQMNKSDGQEYFNDIIKDHYPHIKNCTDKETADYCLEVINLYKKRHGAKEVAKILSSYASYTADSKKVRTAAEVVKKYIDNRVDRIIEVMDSYMNSTPLHIEELLTNRAYNRIKKDQNQVKMILIEYGQLTKKISDEEVRKEITYQDLDKIVAIEQLILNIHEKRNQRQQREISDGFYKELNRSVHQGRNLKQRINNLRRYCNEVEDKVKKNVEELMFVD